MESIPTPQLLDRFAAVIAANGIEAVPSSMFAAVADEARRVDASRVAVDVLVDPTEPPVARERAFRKLVIQIVGRSGRPTAPSPRRVLEPA
jgi:hypothetical protein